LPFAVDVYNGATKKRYNVEISNKTDTLRFPAERKPDLINVDADRVLLSEKKDSKTLQQYIHQYKYAATFIDRNEALDFAAANIHEPAALQLVKDALNDRFYLIRRKAIGSLYDSVLDVATINRVASVAAKDPNRLVRADAVELLGSLKDPKFRDLFLRGTKDSSYTVAGASLLALLDIDEKAATSLVPELKKDAKGGLEQALKIAEIFSKTDADFAEMYADFTSAGIMDKINKFSTFNIYLSRVENTANFKRGLDALVQFRNRVSPFIPGFKEAVNKEFELLRARKLRNRTASNSAAIDEQVKYIVEAINK
jgi:aminopeptidase N